MLLPRGGRRDGLRAGVAPCHGHAVEIPLPALAAVVLAAFTVETALGFGATVITVALAGLVAPIESVLPAFVPANVALSAYVAARYRGDIDRRVLLGRVLPLMGLGLPVGLLVFQRLGSSRLQLGFGLFVALLAAFELVARRRPDRPPPGRAAGGVLLIAAGIIHGVFATGGPLVVYVLGRELGDKARFRATLSALWLALNLALCVSYAAAGRLHGKTLATSATLLVPLVAGIGLGELVHRRVPEKTFRVLIFALLWVAGVLLAARAAGR